MRIGTALHCEIRPSTFHRKNYFYPDMPKDYQISQYDEPINVDGWLRASRRHPGRHRAGPHGRGHRQDHPRRRRRADPRGRLLPRRLQPRRRAAGRDREPPRHPHGRAGACLRRRAARSILVASGASDGKMEEGSMRVDANVSVRRAGRRPFGTRCEIKNLNSLRSLGRAIEYEAERQIELIEVGRAGRPADPPLGRGRGPHRGTALQGGGVRLPVLPGTGPRAAGARRRSGRLPWRQRSARCRPTGEAGSTDSSPTATGTDRRPCATRSDGGRSGPRRPGHAGRGRRRRCAAGPGPYGQRGRYRCGCGATCSSADRTWPC